MNKRVLILTTLGLPLFGGSQEPPLIGFPPSRPVEESKIAIFENGETKTKEAYSNFRLKLRYSSGNPATLTIGEAPVELPAGNDETVDLTYEHLLNAPARIRLSRSGDLEPQVIELEGSTVSEGRFVSTAKTAREDFPMDGDFTLMARFETRGNGTLAAKAPPAGKWQLNGKSLFIRGGKLVYDIGWVGAVNGKKKVNNGKPHAAVVVVKDGNARLMLDGKLDGQKKDFTSEDNPKHVFKVGGTAANFGGDFENGEIHRVMFWKRALDDTELQKLQSGNEDEVNTPDFHWKPSAADRGEIELTQFGAVEGIAANLGLETGGDFKLREAWIQPLEKSDHRELVAGWNGESFERGKAIYHTLCVTCHGTPEQEGSLPLSLKFHEGEFKNGNDPFRMWQTIHKGFGLMVPQPQYSTRQKYDVIHYIREAWLKEHNPKQLFEIDDNYLASLPRGMSLIEEKEAEARPPQYELMDFGPALFWTYQIEPGPLEPGVNMAYKGLAIRLDEGPGGVSKGNTWAVYDLDTMRLAAVYTGDQFVDWKGIAFDGSHGTHTSIVGERLLTTPNGPGWANPKTGEWEDPRLVGRDGRKFGPLPRDWVHFKGLDLEGDPVTLKYTIGGIEITETPVWKENSFSRHLVIGKSEHDLELRLEKDKTLTIDAAKTPITVVVGNDQRKAPLFIDPTVFEGSVKVKSRDERIERRFPGTTTTKIKRGAEDGPFAVDILTVPDADLNPWQSWMRTSGLDFFADGKRAAVCTWMGDVWIVSGIDQLEGELKWQRICSGLFQPLGLKIVDEQIYVTCRDMIAKLHDTNGDDEIDFIENFNNDHQVTEHFHEFAMGLQTDAEGNFYYAKSARHAKTALVPHHGTLLRVSPDGSKTDILASGFRAANGVCLNPDGTFIVTDQEGHWNPKNRINWVQGKGPEEFFGNIFGYTPVTDESDDAMTQPMCWITNAFDRSPSELLWVPEKAKWGPLNGSLLNLSYGYGKIYVAPHEMIGGQPQGGMCQLPIEQFPTGVMRGRFHPENGQFYGCGMFAWGSNQKQAGGFYRVRYTGKPALLPTGLKAKSSGIAITFSDPADPEFAVNPENYTVKTWGLLRSANYGSKHLDEKELSVKSVSVSADSRTVTLEIPEIHATRGMEIVCRLKSAEGGEPVERVIHNTIHRLPDRG